VVLEVNGDDVTVAMITSKHKPDIPERRYDYPIQDWRGAGLLRPSYIRPSRLTTVHSSLCRRIGTLPAHELEALRRSVGPSTLLQDEVARLRYELDKWRSVARRLPGQPRTPEELAFAIDNLQRHIRRLEQTIQDLSNRRSGPGPIRGR